MKSYSPYQFAFARILAGGLTLGLALESLRHTGQAAAPDVSMYVFGGVIGVFLGGLLVFGLFRRSAALLAMFALAGFAFFFRSAFESPPAVLFAMYLVLALTPPGEPLRVPSLARARTVSTPGAWIFPKWIAFLALAIGAAGAGSLIFSESPTGAIQFTEHGPHLRATAWSAVAIVLLIGVNFAWIFPVRRPDSESQQAIVFFDGVCGLCNSAVDFILAQDYAGVLRYAPIQGDTAARLLPPENIADMDSMVYRNRAGAMFTRSDAILRVGLELGGIWKPGALMGLLLVPRPIRNAAYNLVAKHRYRWFGKKESCRMPGPEERELFLM